MHVTTLLSRDTLGQPSITVIDGPRSPAEVHRALGHGFGAVALTGLARRMRRRNPDGARGASGRVRTLERDLGSVLPQMKALAAAVPIYGPLLSLGASAAEGQLLAREEAAAARAAILAANNLAARERNQRYWARIRAKKAREAASQEAEFTSFMGWVNSAPLGAYGVEEVRATWEDSSFDKRARRRRSRKRAKREEAKAEAAEREAELKREMMEFQERREVRNLAAAGISDPYGEAAFIDPYSGATGAPGVGMFSTPAFDPFWGEGETDWPLGYAEVLGTEWGPEEAYSYLEYMDPVLFDAADEFVAGMRDMRVYNRRVNHQADEQCNLDGVDAFRGSLPTGRFYTSRLIDASVVKGLGGETYGSVELAEFPFRVSVSGNHGDARARVALTHELAHVFNHLHKAGLDHKQVHELGIFYATEGLPALQAFEAHTN